MDREAFNKRMRDLAAERQKNRPPASPPIRELGRSAFDVMGEREREEQQLHQERLVLQAKLATEVRHLAFDSAVILGQNEIPATLSLPRRRLGAFLPRKQLWFVRKDESSHIHETMRGGDPEVRITTTTQAVLLNTDGNLHHAQNTALSKRVGWTKTEPQLVESSPLALTGIATDDQLVPLYDRSGTLLEAEQGEAILTAWQEDFLKIAVNQPNSL